jgi:membrane protein
LGDARAPPGGIPWCVRLIVAGTDPTDHQPGRLQRLVLAPVEFARDWLARFVSIQGVDRGMALGAQAFTALIPLLIVYSAIVPRADGQDFADHVIDRFELTGSAADTVKQAFAPTGDVTSSVNVLGVVLLIVSALAFTRGLQRLYEGAFKLPAAGVRGTGYGLTWLVTLCIVISIRPLVVGRLHGVALGAGTLAFSLLIWVLTPYLLLGKRIPWRRLIPAATLAALGMTAFGVASLIWMPHSVATSAQEFGFIGIAFAFLSWLVGAGVVLVVAAAGGAIIDERLQRRRAPAAG